VLRPVDRLSQAILTVDPVTLKPPISTSAAPDEILPVIERLNILFGKVESAFAHEKATIANIAHELRTPIAGLRTTLEFALAGAAAGAPLPIQEKCLAITIRMQAMIANLLTLARLEAGLETCERQPMDLSEAVRSTWELREQQAIDRALTVHWRLPASAMVDSAPEQLGMVLNNVLDNAVSHTPHRGVIEISITPRADTLVLDVVNTTDGSLVNLDKVFQPFWRGDHARSGGVHCGLGLALCQRIVALLGGSISAEIEQPEQFRLRLVLPRG